MDDYDREKVDEIVLALMYLTLHDSSRAVNHSLSLIKESLLKRIILNHISTFS